MTSKRNNNILIRLKIICVIKKRALIFWYYKTTILKKKKKVSQKFLSRQKPISVGSKMISRNSDKFLETPYRSFLEIYRSFSKSFWTHGNRYSSNDAARMNVALPKGMSRSRRLNRPVTNRPVKSPVNPKNVIQHVLRVKNM